MFNTHIHIHTLFDVFYSRLFCGLCVCVCVCVCAYLCVCMCVCVFVRSYKKTNSNIYIIFYLSICNHFIIVILIFLTILYHYFSVLRPVAANVKLIVNKDENSALPKFTVDFILDDIEVLVSRQQVSNAFHN